MKTKARLLVLAVACGMIAGCATNRDHSAQGGEREMGTQSGSGQYAPAPAPRQPPMSPNGSIGPGNPFGLDSGNVAF